jgi:hypothetical protein
MELPSQMEQAIADFVDYYNTVVTKGTGNVTPAVVLYGRKKRSCNAGRGANTNINRRRDYNRDLRELINAA